MPSAHTSVSISMSSRVEHRVTYKAHGISYHDSVRQIEVGLRQDEPPERYMLNGEVG